MALQSVITDLLVFLRLRRAVSGPDFLRSDPAKSRQHHATTQCQHNESADKRGSVPLKATEAEVQMWGTESVAVFAMMLNRKVACHKSDAPLVRPLSVPKSSHWSDSPLFQPWSESPLFRPNPSTNPNPNPNHNPNHNPYPNPNPRAGL